MGSGWCQHAAARRCPRLPLIWGGGVSAGEGGADETAVCGIERSGSVSTVTSSTIAGYIEAAEMSPGASPRARRGRVGAPSS